MNTSNKKEDFSHRLFERLDRFFIRDSFQNKVKEIRKKLHIPKNGFLTWGKWVSWVKKDVKKNGHLSIPNLGLLDESMKLNEDLNLPYNYSFWIEAYIVLGENYLDYRIECPRKNHHSGKAFALPPDYCNAIDFEKGFDCLNIKLYVGASIRETLNFISRNKKVIETYLGELNKQPKAVRERIRKELHDLVYEYYLKGWLNKYGEIGIGYDDFIPEEIKKLNMDVRRNIIRQEMKNRS